MGDELRAGLGGGIEGDANAVGNKDTSISHNVAGRDLVENNYYPPPKLPADHQYRKYTLADVIALLIGNDLTGDPGLVKRVIEVERELATLRQEVKENQEKPVTLVQVVSAILAVVFLIIIVLMLGIWLGGMR